MSMRTSRRNLRPRRASVPSVTRTWRLESAALFGLWASATALLVAAAVIPSGPVRAEALARAPVTAAAPAR
ncbi:MAG: hypothetical protein JWM10_1486, partial [Myxococcaceae bacterium]|nr:hypothetical protein [Myxococcaceae bacterium]